MAFFLATGYLLLTTGATGCQKNKSVEVRGTELLPAPQKNVLLKEDVSLDPEKLKITHLYPGADEEDRFATNLLKDEIKRLFGYDMNY